MLYWFAYIIYTWNDKTFECTIPYHPSTDNVETLFKVMHPTATIKNIDYEM